MNYISEIELPNGTLYTIKDADTRDRVDTLESTFSGATSSTAGVKGLVPSPSAGQQNLFLRGDSSWETPHGAVQYTATIPASGWSNGTYTLALSALTCGGGSVSPIVSPTSNVEEYSKIASATATAGTGIKFTLESGETISSDISLLIVDFS